MHTDGGMIKRDASRPYVRKYAGVLCADNTGIQLQEDLNNNNIIIIECRPYHSTEMEATLL